MTRLASCVGARARRDLRHQALARATGPGWSSGSDLTRAYWNRFDVATGVRAAFFIMAPLLLGLATNQVNAGVISSIGALNADVVSTLGALNVSFEEGPEPSRRKLLGGLLIGCVTNAVAFSAGTLIGTTGTLVAILLVAAGVFATMAIRARRGLELVGLVAAVVFTVGVGLPGGSVAAAWTRFWLILAGGLWAILGTALQTSLRPPRPQGGQARRRQLAPPSMRF